MTIKSIICWTRKIVNSRVFYIPFFIATFVFVYYRFISQTSDVFKGAFLGIIVSYLSYFLTKLRELNIRKFNCMVYLEQEFNLCINALSDNLYQMDRILESFSPTVLFPSELKLTENYIKDLGRLDLRRDIYIFYVGLNKFNHDLNAITTVYEKNMKNFTQASFQSIEEGREAFKQFYSFYKEKIGELKTAGTNLESELKDCLAKLRFFLRVDRPFLNRYLLPYYSEYDYAKWIIEDRKKLEQELIESRSLLIKK